MEWVFLFSGMALWIVAVRLTWENDNINNAALGCLFLSIAVSDLIAGPILRRRVKPPCVRLRPIQNGAFNIVLTFFFVAFVVFLLVSGGLHSLRRLLLMGPIMVSMLIYILLDLFQKIEICRNGVWQNGRLQPWEDYEAFSWKRISTDSIELRLVSKSWICRSTRLTASHEDREAVLKLLEPNVPEISL
jgi:hypothetical protein